MRSFLFLAFLALAACEQEQYRYGGHQQQQQGYGGQQQHQGYGGQQRYGGQQQGYGGYQQQGYGRHQQQGYGHNNYGGQSNGYGSSQNDAFRALKFAFSDKDVDCKAKGTSGLIECSSDEVEFVNQCDGKVGGMVSFECEQVCLAEVVPMKLLEANAANEPEVPVEAIFDCTFTFTNEHGYGQAENFEVEGNVQLRPSIAPDMTMPEMCMDEPSTYILASPDAEAKDKSKGYYDRDYDVISFFGTSTDVMELHPGTAPTPTMLVSFFEEAFGAQYFMRVETDGGNNGGYGGYPVQHGYGYQQPQNYRGYQNYGGHQQQYGGYQQQQHGGYQQQSYNRQPSYGQQYQGGRWE